MNYYLLIFTLFILFLKIRISKDWLKPSVLFSLGFSFAAFVLAINTKKWGVEISFISCFVIIISQLSIWAGEAIGIRIKGKNVVVGNRDSSSFVYSKRKEQMLFYFSLICLLGLILLRVLDIRRSHATYGVGQFILSNYRRYGVEETSSNFLMKFLEIISSMLCYYMFCDYCISKSILRKRKISYFLIFGLYLLSCVLSSSRSNIFHFLFAFTMIWVLTNRYNKKSIKISFRTKRKIVVILIIGLVAFGLLGNLTGKTQTGGFLDSIAVYSAGSIPAFDIYIDNFDGVSHFGYYTLQSLRRVLELLGVNVTYTLSYYSHGDFIQYGNGYTTNIYTCLKNYVADYGIIGSQICLFLIGFVFGKIYNYSIKSNTITPCRYTVYSYLVFYVFFSFITERVFSQILTVTTALGVVFLCGLFKVLPIKSEELIKGNEEICDI